MFLARIIQSVPRASLSTVCVLLLTSCQLVPNPPLAGSRADTTTPSPSVRTPAATVRSAEPLRATVPPASSPRSTPPTTNPAAIPATPGDHDVAILATVTATGGQDTARNAIDGKLDTLWSADAAAPQSDTLALDRAYLIDSIHLVVAQTPAGQTTHEIWLGDPSGSLHLYKRLVNTGME